MIKTKGNCLYEGNIYETKNEIKENGLIKTKINLMNENENNIEEL